MDTIIISKENHFLHICNEGNKINYNFYDKEANLLDGGTREYENIIYNTNEVAKELIESFKDTISFLEPYIYVEKENVSDLLELLEEQDYNHLQNKVADYRKKDVIENDEREI